MRRVYLAGPDVFRPDAEAEIRQRDEDKPPEE